MPHLTVAQRKEIGKAQHFHGIIEHYADKYNVSRATVQRWRSEGDKQKPVWTDAPGRGRKRVLSSAEKQSAKRKADNRKCLTNITSSLNAKRQKTVSKTTVGRALKAGRDPLSYQPVTHGRQLSKPNERKRDKFAGAHKNAHTGRWVFLDSKYLYIYEDGRGFCHFAWQRLKKKKLSIVRSNPTVLHFYAGIALGWKSKLFFVPPTPPLGSKARKSKETFKSKHFIRAIKTIDKELCEWAGTGHHYKYVMDRAKQHTSKASTKAMKRAGVVLVEGFPAQSWDINIIENAWGDFDNKLQGSRGKTPDGWRRCIKRSWDQVEQTTIDKLVRDVKPRLQQVVEKKGQWLKKKK